MALAFTHISSQADGANCLTNWIKLLKRHFAGTFLVFTGVRNVLEQKFNFSGCLEVLMSLSHD